MIRDNRTAYIMYVCLYRKSSIKPWGLSHFSSTRRASKSRDNWGG